MQFVPDAEFLGICDRIASEGLSIDEWAEVESDDQFRTAHYCGGFDATEMAFCFSRRVNGNECWFQLTLDQVLAIAARRFVEVSTRDANL